MNEFNIMPKRKIKKVEDTCCGDKLLFDMAEKYVQLLTGAKPKLNTRRLSKPLEEHKQNDNKGCF